MVQSRKEERTGTYWRNLRKRDHFEDLSVDGRILERIFNKQTSCELEGPDIEFHWGARFSVPVQTGPGAHPASCSTGNEVLSRSKAAGA